MYTLGYSFKPWTEAKAIADGPSILNYVRETARENGIDRKIRFGHRVKRASWSSRTRAGPWRRSGAAKEAVRFTCNFLFMCSGYYSYEGGYTPDFPGAERFKGRIVHPQKWTGDIDYAGKRVVVIGSRRHRRDAGAGDGQDRGACHHAAALADLRRLAARPRTRIANRLREMLPAKLAYDLIRWRNVLFGMYFFQLCRRKPERAKQMILGGVRHALGPDYDVDTHFTPRYNPWDQRLCLVPDGDLFEAIKAGPRLGGHRPHRDLHRERHPPRGPAASSTADLIVTATGLNLQVLGGMQVSVDGRAVDSAKTLTYKGMMYSDVPNLASSFGYTNASWTLKCDLTCEYVCRLLNHMDKHGYRQCTPRNVDPTVDRGDLARFLVRLRAALDGEVAEAGLEARRGSSTRTTRSTSSPCGSARSTTA